MIVTTLQRNKCIGCGYCVEMAPENFKMSNKDGKTVLLKSENKKGFFTTKSKMYSQLDSLQKASVVCPVKIISVKNV